MNSDLARYVRTIRHLKPVQIYGRIQHRITRPRIDVHGVPRLHLSNAGWIPPIERDGVLTGPSTVRLLNHAGEISRAEHWNDPSQDKLWLYNLHYFDDLKANADRSRRSWQGNLVTRWIAENPVGEGNGWEPYPLSLRIVNWLKWALGGAKFEDEWASSLALQARYLARRIEWHLLGNHLLANAKALVFAGVCFAGDEADDWLRAGLAIYRRELAEQVLDDGGHFERSPMYHAIVLEDLLDVANLLCANDMHVQPILPVLRAAIGKMLDWLDAMVHPDGQIAFFNDATFGIAAEPSAIFAYAARLGFGASSAKGQRLRYLPRSGYARMEYGKVCAILDVAPVGPDYLPGHAHADTLSFELSVGGQRAIVNCGTSVYGAGDQRHFERSTAAHSTVEINGENSSEVWSSFRTGRRARIIDVEAKDEARSTTVSASHDGYRHHPGKPVHCRTWTMDEAGLTVDDRIEGDYQNAVARFHLGDGVKAVADSGGGGHLELPDGARVEWVSGTPARVGASQWHPQFGMSVATEVLEFPVIDHGLKVQLRWM